jgi:hypothetical protein
VTAAPGHSVSQGQCGSSPVGRQAFSFEAQAPQGVRRRARIATVAQSALVERWLLESGFAEPNGEPGRLVPAVRARDRGRLTLSDVSATIFSGIINGDGHGAPVS